MTELSDELLVAYVDGQLARAQSRAVEKVLRQDDVLARRVDALKAAHGRLEAAFEAILAGEVEDISQYAPQVEEKPARGFVLSLVSAASGICIGLAAAAGALHFWPQMDLWPQTTPLAPAPAPAPSPVLAPKQSDRLLSSWQDEVARSEALLSRASLEVGLDSEGNRDLVAFELAGAIGPNLQVPDLEPQGFSFVRGALLQYGDKPLAQLLYLPEEGNPLALYAMPSERDSDPVLDQVGPIATVTWSKGGVTYLLAQNGDANALLRLAGKVENEPLAPVPTPPTGLADQPAPDATPGATPSTPPAAEEATPTGETMPASTSSGPATAPVTSDSNPAAVDSNAAPPATGGESSQVTAPQIAPGSSPTSSIPPAAPAIPPD